MLHRFTCAAVLAGLIVVLLVPGVMAQSATRATTSEKGSVLIYPKVELRWNAAGELIQDTFISITNDNDDEVMVLMYFVSETCTNVDNDITLTHNQPAWWSAFSGLPGPNGGVSPFTVLGAPYPDPEGSTDLVLRGYIVAWAINDDHAQIRWNHLAGEATIVNYADGDAWEYTAYAFAALVGDTGDIIGEPGIIALNGIEYASGFDLLLLDFFASGSQAFSGGSRTVLHDTDLTLLILDQDFTQETPGPFKTKAHFDIWNENEISFSGMEYCITKWDQSLLSNHGGHFLRRNLQTDKGKARIDGMQSVLCPQSTAESLLGVEAKLLTFNGTDLATAGTTLVGMGTQAASILYDIPSGGGEKAIMVAPAQVSPTLKKGAVR